MAQQIINIGTSANKGDGDPLRLAFDKVNDNFTELYAGLGSGSSSSSGSSSGSGQSVQDGQTVTVDVQGSLLADDSTVAFNSATGEFTGDLTGNATLTNLTANGVIDFTNARIDFAGAQFSNLPTPLYVDIVGSVFADDSTLLVDGVNGTIDASALTGALPALDGSALTGITAGTATSLDGDMKGSVYADDSTLLVDGVGGTIAGPISSQNWMAAYDGYVTISNGGNTVPGPIQIVASANLDLSAGAGQVINANRNIVAAEGVTGDLTGNVTGDVNGSVFADDSTLLVDGVNGTVNISNQSIDDLSDVNTTTYVGPPSRSMQPLIWDDIDNVWYPGNGISITANLTMEDNSFIMLRENAYLNFEGSITDGFDTKFLVVNPTANRTIRLPDADGTVALASTTLAGYGITDAQAALVSGTNIKTVNGESLLGSGNIVISGGSGGGSAFTNIGVGADDSTIRNISEGESFLILGGTGITTASDAEGNITITGVAQDFAFSSLTGTPTTISGYGITDALTAGGALTGSSLEPTSVGTGDGNDLTLTGGDATELNSTGGDTNITGGSGALASGNVNIGTTQTVAVSIGASGVGTSIGGTLTANGNAIFNTGVQEKFATLTGSTGVTAMDCDNGQVFYLTGAAGDITANFTNLGLLAEYGTNVTVIINQGATPYEVTAVQIGGSGQTIEWQGGLAPTGNANGIDSFSFTILRDGGSYVVLGQMVDFT